jgi:hypothetical protein
VKPRFSANPHRSRRLPSLRNARTTPARRRGS